MPASDQHKNIPTEPSKLPNDEWRLTRSLVLEALLEEDERRSYWKEVCRRDDIDVHLAQSSQEHGPDGTDAEAMFQETRSWLDALYEEEKSNANSTPEYRCECIVLHPEGQDLPSFSPDKGERDLPRTLIMAPGLALDTPVLDRISQGRGPRSKEREDLIAPLRLQNAEDTRSTETFTESYQELLEMLQAWNRHVASIPDQTMEQKELLDALTERNKLITDIENGQKDHKELDLPCPRLQHALLAFRPETARFENQNFSDILVMMVANLRIASPDLDDDMKSAIIRVLFNEARVELLLDEQYLEKRRTLQSEINAAHRRDDHAEMKRLQKQRRSAQDESICRRAEWLIDHIKIARRNLYSRLLLDIQDLTVHQAGQKAFASENMSAPQELALKYSQAKNALGFTVKELLAAEALSEADAINVTKMLNMTKDCCIRVRKFAALDRDPADRERTMRERIQHPETASMMARVVEDIQGIKELPMLVVDHMSDLERSLESVHRTASLHFRALDGLLLLLGEDSENPET